MMFVKEESEENMIEPETWRIKHEEPETCRIKQEEQGDFSLGLMDVKEERQDLDEVEEKQQVQRHHDINGETSADDKVEPAGGGAVGPWVLSPASCQIEDPGTDQKSRRRRQVASPSTWKTSTRKKLYQEGKGHVNTTTKKASAKQVRTLKNCIMSCKYKCAKKVSPAEREKCFTQFYQLSQNRKYDFIATTTDCREKERQTCDEPRRKRTYSFKYYLNVEGEKVRVCKQFYLGTLAISQKPVYNIHMKKNQTTSMPKPDARGKHPKKCIDVNQKEQVKAHIGSFPVVESHYCRAGAKRQYLEPTLNVSRMYDLYRLRCSENGNTPVKGSYYRFIFNTEFNLSFRVPKKDRCPQCEAYETAVKKNKKKHAKPK